MLIRGAAFAIGSELSGGISDIFIQDCKIGNLVNGFQIKTTKDRGGYVKNIVMRDCSIQKITIVTNVNYNNDGAAAAKLTWFKNMEFTNLDMSGGKQDQTLIDVNGFPDDFHYTRNVSFQNIRLPQGAKIKVNNCEDVVFKNVQTKNAGQPVYLISESRRIEH